MNIGDKDGEDKCIAASVGEALLYKYAWIVLLFFALPSARAQN